MIRHSVPITLFVLLFLYESKRRCFAFGFSANNANKCYRRSTGVGGVFDRRRFVGTLLQSSLEEGDEGDEGDVAIAGDLERLKAEEARLATLLASVRARKLSVLRSRPLNIGVVGMGRFGLFVARSFAKYGNVVGTSRSDYGEVAEEIGARFVPFSDLESFVVEEDLDVIVIAVSIVSFDETVKAMAPHIRKRMELKGKDSCPLVVDVASVKEHPRSILLEHLPKECDVLCTHPMFGPDSAGKGWQGQTFVYERTRINGVLMEDCAVAEGVEGCDADNAAESPAGDGLPSKDACMATVEGMDRMERFLSIWEEEGCNMVPMSCEDHDAYAANSQFITHLVGRVLDAQGLHSTPIDTKGFQSVLKLIGNTNADSFDLFYGLYKYNRNSGYTIGRLRGALDDVVGDLLQRDGVVGVFGNGSRRNNGD